MIISKKSYDKMAEKIRYLSDENEKLRNISKEYISNEYHPTIECDGCKYLLIDKYKNQFMCKLNKDCEDRQEEIRYE